MPRNKLDTVLEKLRWYAYEWPVAVAEAGSERRAKAAFRRLRASALDLGVDDVTSTYPDGTKILDAASSKTTRRLRGLARSMERAARGTSSGRQMTWRDLEQLGWIESAGKGLSYRLSKRGKTAAASGVSRRRT